MTELLWEPGAEEVERAGLTRFTAFVRERHGVDAHDYAALHAWSVAERAAFWDSVWEFCEVVADRKGGVVLEDGDRMPGARWFPDARLNFAENLLRRRDDGPAIVFRGEAPSAGADRTDDRRISWRQLHDHVSRAAQGLRAAGVGPGDRVAGYLPNLPETVVSMLAATSLGAVWSSCSPDFGAQGVLDRFGQIRPKVLVGADGYRYNGAAIDSLGRIREVLAGVPGVERTVIVPYLRRTPDLRPVPGAISWDEFTLAHPAREIGFEPVPFDHPLCIMYSSGTTGAPKCIVHSTGGTLLQHLKEHRLHVDVRPGDTLFYFTTCGWMMWNWLVSGLASGACIALYEGSPGWPDLRALFDFADAARIEVFGTSAAYLDTLRKSCLRPRDSHDLSAVRTILSTGSPLAPETFDFVYDAVKPDVRLSSITGGTDIMGCFAQGNPAAPVRRGEIQCLALGMRVEVFDDEGRPLSAGEPGELVCTAPFPSMPAGFWNDPDGAKYRSAYFERFPGVWHHGDWAERTGHGGLVVHGRSDAVLNPGGVRIGTAEIYRQVEQLDEVEESIVIAQDREGDVRVVLFVRLRPGLRLDDALADRIRRQIRNGATPRHVPARILEVADIPRTRNGKLVELAVRDIVHGRLVRNREALANPEALELFADRPELSDRVAGRGRESARPDPSAPAAKAASERGPERGGGER